MEFDIQTAVNAALARKTDLERQEELKFQEERRKELKTPSSISARAELGKRMVALAETNLDENPTDFDLTRLAEGLAFQGHYQDAHDITRDPLKRNEYAQIIEAIAGKADCACPTKQQNQPTRFVKDIILIDGNERNLIACALCGNQTC